MTEEIKESIARKLEGLAERIRNGEVMGFSLEWNWLETEQSSQHPEVIIGPLIVSMHHADEYIDHLSYKTTAQQAEDLQAKIAIASTPGSGILVEDLSTDEEDDEELGDDFRLYNPPESDKVPK